MSGISDETHADFLISLWVTADYFSQILDCFLKVSFQSPVTSLSSHSFCFHWCRWHFRWFSVFTVFAHMSCSASWLLISICFIFLLTVNVFLSAQLFWILDCMSSALILSIPVHVQPVGYIKSEIVFIAWYVPRCSRSHVFVSLMNMDLKPFFHLLLILYGKASSFLQTLHSLWDFVSS